MAVLLSREVNYQIELGFFSIGQAHTSTVVPPFYAGLKRDLTSGAKTSASPLPTSSLANQ